MTKIIKDIKSHYVNIDQQLIRDESLSWKARGIFMYLWSQDDGWDFYATEVAKHATDGLDALNSGLNELEKQGYLTRKRKRDQQGHLKGTDWILHENPNKSKQQQEKPIQDSAIQENPTLSIINQKNYQLKELSKESKDIVGLPPDTVSEPEKQPKSSSGTIPYSEILNYLNRKAGAQYHATSKTTQRLIKARWHEGFSLPDFKKVIDNKVAEWLHDATMSKYLRPQTLFGTKFESYLNESQIEKNKEPTGLGW